MVVPLITSIEKNISHRRETWTVIGPHYIQHAYSEFIFYLMHLPQNALYLLYKFILYTIYLYRPVKKKPVSYVPARIGVSTV